MNKPSMEVYNQVAIMLHKNKQRQEQLTEARAFVEKTIANPQAYNGKSKEEVLELAQSSLKQLAQLQSVLDEELKNLEETCHTYNRSPEFEVAKIMVVDKLFG